MKYLSCLPGTQKIIHFHSSTSFMWIHKGMFLLDFIVYYLRPQLWVSDSQKKGSETELKETKHEETQHGDGDRFV